MVLTGRLRSRRTAACSLTGKLRHVYNEWCACLMNEIDLRRLDLNLLVTFEVLMAEGSVTRAATRLGRTQSAVSHALGRLREQVGDPLLVKADGRMHPSPFALTLITEVRPILRAIQRVVAPPEPFHPATSTRVFRIAAPAFSALVSAIFRRVHKLAPRVSLEWTLPNVEALPAVAEGRVALAHLGGDTRLPDGVDVHATRPFTWVTFLRRHHPALTQWDIDAWTAWPHVTVSIGNAVQNPIDEALCRLGLRRTIGARIPEFSGVAPLLAGTNMLGTFPPLALADDARVYGLLAKRPPVPLAPFSSRFFWSSRLANDPGNRWIRGIVLDIYTRLHQRAEARLSHFAAPRRGGRAPTLAGADIAESGRAGARNRTTGARPGSPG
jgi:DNA-binding transcriptional LysR family regulator